MEFKEDLRYDKEHEWVKREGKIAYIGITDFAQNSLGDIIFVEMPDGGTVLSAGDIFGVVESVKAASDLYCPVSGIVVDINKELEDSPELINEDPYETWIIKVELSDPTEVDDLMTAAEYEEFVSKE